LAAVWTALMNESISGTKWEIVMDLSHEEKEMRDRFLRAMLEAALPLQAGLEAEMTLQALIRAADMLKERFEQELDELRQEAD
jgi:hypothetical protein